MSEKGNEASQPETVTEGAAVVVTVEQPAAPAEHADEAIVDDVSERVTALETRITETLGNRDQWTSQTTQTITSLQQEVADLKATLSTVTQSQQQTVQELRDELTRLSLALRKAEEPPETVDTLLVVTPPETPPEPETPPSPSAGGHPAPENHKAKKGKRVI